MSDTLIDGSETDATPVTALPVEAMETWLEARPEAERAWLEKTGFKAKAGKTAWLPAADGVSDRVLFCLPDGPGLWDWAALPAALPAGDYGLDGEISETEAADAALAWGLATYRFQRYRDNGEEPPRLVWPDAAPHADVLRAIRFTTLVRDLVNMPANDLGPGELAGAAEDLAREFGADCRIVVGDDLLTEGYPAVHTVGRAHDREPRFVDVKWGLDAAPKLTIIGKGVTFDTGGLDLKPASAMELMKKDMGGAAHALALAGMVMDAGLDVRLRLLVPAVENSVSSNAFRPGDVVATRKGLTVEIGNTDAEGRVILADALADAASEEPDLVIDFATLTGAARVALGTELPALFCNDDEMAEALLAAARDVGDPLWRMPLWQGYAKEIEGKVADLNNAPSGRFGGAITAALFLERFADGIERWAHIDLMAWMTSAKPGRPAGGEAMGLRAAFEMIKRLYG